MKTIDIIRAEDKAAVGAVLSRTHSSSDKVRKDSQAIVDRVRKEGYPALRDFTRRFDGADLSEDDFEVKEEEWAAAYQALPAQVIAAIRRAAANIRAFHERQKLASNLETDAYGNITGQLVRPLERVGCYVPGGTASYPSSVLMTALPAQVAGVKEIIMVSPPQASGQMDAASLVAAREAGVTRIFKVGGAQAVAALAYGAGPLERVDKIVGPGNAYVTMAKKICYGEVDIDMLAGPSEILVVADESAPAHYVAADLLSQAEHDPLSSSVCLTLSDAKAQAVKEALEEQLEGLDRKDIARASLAGQGALVVCQTLEGALDLANDFAPEHLELCVERPFDILHLVKNAGAVFLGYHTPEAVGDYMAGPNHVLPTSGTARFYSPLNLHTYLKKTSLIAYSPEGLKAYGQDIVRLADQEGLGAHAQSVALRLKTMSDLERGK